MLMIIPPASSSAFLPHSQRVHIQSPHRVAMRFFLLVSILCLSACLRKMGGTGIVPVLPTVVVFVVLFLSLIGWTLPMPISCAHIGVSSRAIVSSAFWCMSGCSRHHRHF